MDYARPTSSAALSPSAPYVVLLASNSLALTLASSTATAPTSTPSSAANAPLPWYLRLAAVLSVSIVLLVFVAGCTMRGVNVRRGAKVYERAMRRRRRDEREWERRWVQAARERAAAAAAAEEQCGSSEDGSKSDEGRSSSLSSSSGMATSEDDERRSMRPRLRSRRAADPPSSRARTTWVGGVAAREVRRLRAPSSGSWTSEVSGLSDEDERAGVGGRPGSGGRSAG